MNTSHIITPPLKVVRTYKYRLYPTKSQQSNLKNQLSMCRYLYNWSLEERKILYAKDKSTISAYDQISKLPALKQQRPWFKGVYSQCLQHVLLTLDEAYKNFYRSLNKDASSKVGTPRFKKKGQWSTLTFSQYNFQVNNLIYIPKLGVVKMVYHRQLPPDAKIKQLKVTYQAGKYFACFTCEHTVQQSVSKQLLPMLGIDMGCSKFYTASDGSVVNPPDKLKHLHKLLKQLQRRFAKVKRYSTKWYKLLKAIQRTYYKIKCFRTNFHHHVANQLLKRTHTIFLEDLNIKNMLSRPKKIELPDGSYAPNGATHKASLHQSISHMGWYSFRTILIYKAEALCKKVVLVPAAYTSQTCSKCSKVDANALKDDRTYKCTCGLTMDRDLNAAINVHNLGMMYLFKKQCNTTRV